MEFKNDDNISSVCALRWVRWLLFFICTLCNIVLEIAYVLVLVFGGKSHWLDCF